MTANLNLEEHFKPSELAMVLGTEEAIASDFINGKETLTWNEMLAVTSFLGVEVNDLHFVPSENAHFLM